VHILLRVVAVLCVAVAVFLLYAVIRALASAAGARAGVAVGYVVGAIFLSAVGAKLWQLAGARREREVATEQ
jgi:hypothetical protein